jgi:hypothetical protein
MTTGQGGRFEVGPTIGRAANVCGWGAMAVVMAGVGVFGIATGLEHWWGALLPGRPQQSRRSQRFESTTVVSRPTSTASPWLTRWPRTTSTGLISSALARRRQIMK